MIEEIIKNKTESIIDYSNFSASDLGEAALFGGSMVLIGMLAVFAVLIILWGCLVLFKIAFHDIPAKKANGALDFEHHSEQEYLDRMKYELSVIEKMGYSEYYLIVWDFVNHAQAAGIPVGPGRGSGAGSLVAYLIGITDVDPLRFDLLFERFLNPERVSMPDFDIDFCYDRRDEAIQYVREKYGEDHTAQIIEELKK